VKFQSLLVANRGEIALRVMRTAKRMGLRTVAVYSDADRNAPHVRAADAAVRIGAAAPRDSYLNVEAILAAAEKSGAQAVHPGYGFLSENAAFAEALGNQDLVWVGPPAGAMRQLGDKQGARQLARALGVPVLRGYDERDQCGHTLAKAAPLIGFPLLIKAVAGGGGRGMRLVRSQAEFAAALASARSEAKNSFGDDRLLLEKAVEGGRHVEVQIFADGHGHCVQLGERDCSVQRRHQKLIEESPCPAADAKARAAIGEAAIAIARATGYAGAGTVEFLRDADGNYWFLEVNTRLQVEHPVTEMVTGLDLVEWQLRVAAGEPLPLRQEEIRIAGHAIEARICAEDPARGHLPGAGRLLVWQAAEGVRCDHALESGLEIPPYYDSLLAKVIAHAPTRDEAREQLAAALDATIALGICTNKAFLAAVLRDRDFAAGKATTDHLSRFKFEPEKPDLQTAAMLLAADYGEWTGWSNNAAHSSRARLDGEMVSFSPPRERKDMPFAVDGGTVHFARGGASFSLRNTLYDPPARQGAGASDGRLLAPMNGKVVAVHAKAGETVAANKALVVLEAMKMEHSLSFSFAVKIKTTHVKAGAQVAPGNLLVEFDPA
jgi:geranyl-CoA carboxylase alpha subunit